MRGTSLLFALAVAALAAPAAAQPVSMPTVLRDVFALHAFDGLDISPRGDAVAWEEDFRPGGLAHPQVQSALFVAKLGARAIRLSGGDGKRFFEESEPRWSPDGTSIAFLSDAVTPDTQQIFLASPAGGHVRRLTRLTGNVQQMRWSPDGRRLAILYIAHPHRRSGALAAGARKIGVIGSVEDEQRLAVVDAKNGAVRELTPSNAYVYEYDWSPNSKRLAYTYAYGSGDNNWWIARLATVDLGGNAHDLYRPADQINAPRWSPDGRNIALIEGLMSDFGSVGGDVYLVDADSGAARNVTPNMPFSAASMRWVSPMRLDVVAHDDGSTHLFAVDTGDGKRMRLTDGTETIDSWSATPNGSVVALARWSFDRAPEIWAGPPHSLKPITSRNAGVPLLTGRAESLHWKNGDFAIQGWLIYPRDFNPAKRYPMITIIHGGPSAASLPTYDSRNIAAFSSSGYFVFEPNPRGSFGHGEAFARANVKDFGYGDWQDDLAGVHTAVHSAPIDVSRLGLYGWSYGGYMGMWAETQTKEFKAIVAGAGVVNWQSYYGQNDIDQWMVPFFGKSVYDDPAVYARSSPITFIKNSATPVLVLQGERDEEVPAPQAFEFYHAMQALKVPSQLVVYADEGHSPRRPANQIDILTRMVGWFGRYLR